MVNKQLRCNELPETKGAAHGQEKTKLTNPT
jgi:hypothetical protein